MIDLDKYAVKVWRTPLLWSADSATHAFLPYSLAYEKGEEQGWWISDDVMQALILERMADGRERRNDLLTRGNAEYNRRKAELAKLDKLGQDIAELVRLASRPVCASCCGNGWRAVNERGGKTIARCLHCDGQGRDDS